MFAASIGLRAKTGLRRGPTHTVHSARLASQQVLEEVPLEPPIEVDTLGIQDTGPFVTLFGYDVLSSHAVINLSTFNTFLDLLFSEK